MQPLIDMKGPGSRVLLAIVDGAEFEVLTYADGSWGIKKGKKLVDIWEPGENEACMIAFAKLIGLDRLKELLIVRTSKAEGQFQFTPPSTSQN